MRYLYLDLIYCFPRRIKGVPVVWESHAQLSRVSRCPHSFGHLLRVTLLRELLQVRLERMPVAQVNMLTSSEPSWVTSICSRPSNPSCRERDHWGPHERDRTNDGWATYGQCEKIWPVCYRIGGSVYYVYFSILDAHVQYLL